MKRLIHPSVAAILGLVLLLSGQSAFGQFKGDTAEELAKAKSRIAELERELEQAKAEIGELKNKLNPPKKVFKVPADGQKHLRQINVGADKATIDTAIEMRMAGWAYAMPQPKSGQAAWGNGDRRTTWYLGYWVNEKTQDNSTKQPIKNDKGDWVGNGAAVPNDWRNGGSPAFPSQIEWLCSLAGGPLAGDNDPPPAKKNKK